MANNRINDLAQYQEPYFVVVDDVQVFSADFVYEQMSAQSKRIDMARAIATGSAVVAALAIVICIIVLSS